MLATTLAHGPTTATLSSAMQKTTRVSVLLPVRNAAATLGACLQSLARQTHADFDCVVVDDGSTDASRDTAARFARSDPRFQVLELPARGLVPALCAGLERCRGAWIARMDADDVAHRERFRLQLEALERDPSLALLGCWARPFPDRQFGDGTREYVRWLRSLRSAADTAREAFVECPVLHPTWMANGDVLRDLGYRDLGFAEDWDLLLRMRRRGLGFTSLPRTLHGWRRSPGCATNADPRYGEDRRVELRAHHLVEGPLASGPDYVLWGHGSTGKALRRALLPRGRRAAAVVEVDARKIGRFVDGVPFVDPGALQPGSPLRELPVVACVAHEGPRRALRQRFVELGLVEGRDVFCAA